MHANKYTCYVYRFDHRLEACNKNVRVLRCSNIDSMQRRRLSVGYVSRPPHPTPSETGTRANEIADEAL